MDAMHEKPWVADAWLPYLAAGIAGIVVGSVVLGAQVGMGLICIGMVCVSFGIFGAAWRVRHGHGLLRRLPPRRPC